MIKEHKGVSILVSINCITYNHERYIADAMEGFLMQETDFDFEILIGEDCSTDNTREIVEEYVKKHPDKIRLITSEKNVGGRGNSRRLEKNSRGKYIAMCEGDDYWTDPLKLQKQVSYMESNPNCTLCFHSAEIVRENKRKTGTIIRAYNKTTVCPTEDIIIGGGGFCPTQSIIYPKVLMDNPPEFLLKAPVGDYPLQLLVASHGEAYYIDETMSAYRTGVKSSWTQRISTREKILLSAEKLIVMLDSFDEYSKYRFSKAVDKAKVSANCEILILKGKTKELKNEEYKEYFKEIGIKEKIKLYARCYFPRIYAKLVSIKARIH